MVNELLKRFNDSINKPTDERRRLLIQGGVSAIALLALSGCVVEELPAGAPEAAGAVTTPFGIFIRKGNESDPKVWEHEMCHVNQALEHGWIDWFNRYGKDKEFARDQEVACGADINSPVYDRLREEDSVASVPPPLEENSE